MSIRDQIIAIMEDHEEVFVENYGWALLSKDFDHVARHISKQLQWLDNGRDGVSQYTSYFDMTDEERHTLTDAEKRGVR
jgi:hypothetical protein